ncbi:MAG: YihY/virulence factor BrkB family protein [Gemmatimonadaceae bacterium]
MSRSRLSRVGWTLRDYAKRVWDNSGEDNIFFLAGGIAFNILLAAVPFLLLLVTGIASFLKQSTAASSAEIGTLIDRLLPPHPESAQSPIHKVLEDVLRTQGQLGLYSAIGFVWFSTRLFGSLRSVLADVFDIEQDRGIVQGKIFDIRLTIVSTLIVVAYTALSGYLALATTRGIGLLSQLGLRQERLGGLEYWMGRIVGFVLITGMFFGLYKFLPNRHIRWKTALFGATVTSVLFELARNLFTSYVDSFNPGSLYTGTLGAIVIVVFWVYYSGLIFILGGEVAQVYDLRRVRRMQRETFEE